MKDNSNESLFDEIHDLLDRERQALIRGDLATVTALYDQKEILVQLLDSLPQSSVSDLSRVHQKLVHNQNLIDGALQGIQHLSTKLTTLRRVRHQLETYGKDGQRHTVEGHVVHQVEKRA